MNNDLNNLYNNQTTGATPQPAPVQQPVQPAPVPQPVQQVQPTQVAPVEPVGQAAPQATMPSQVETDIQGELEAVRQAAVKKQNTVYLIGIVIFIVVSAGIISTGLDASFIFFALMFIGVITAIIAANLKPVKEFIKMYKEKIVVATLNSIFTDVHFDYERGIPSQVIADTNMMMMGNTYYSNDYFYGKYKDILFECSDVTIQEVTTDSDGNTQTTTYFDGQWYIFDFNKTFKGSFQVCEKSFHYSKRQGGLFSKEAKDEKIEMEDQEFNKLFKVFGTDPHSVFYVLTPNTMERIKTINAQIPGSLLFCFKETKLHVGVYNGKDLFEPKLRKPVNIAQDTAQTRKEIDAILQFVDTLKLDNDLFK